MVKRFHKNGGRLPGWLPGSSGNVGEWSTRSGGYPKLSRWFDSSRFHSDQALILDGRSLLGEAVMLPYALPFGGHVVTVLQARTKREHRAGFPENLLSR